MKNKYEIRGDVTAIFLKSEKYGDMETLISTEKLDKVNMYPNTWGVKVGTGAFYVRGVINRNGKQTQVFLHRWVMDAPDGMVVDHFNHDTLDNTNKNLRIITKGENNQNLKGAHKNSKSGVRGVRWCTAANKWQVRIQVNYKNVYNGLFDSKEEATQVAIEKRKKTLPYSNEALSS